MATSDSSAIPNKTLNYTRTEEELLEEYEKYLFSICIYPFVFTIFYMVVGVIGNSVVIYIFAVNGKMSKTTIFILTLAGIDLLSCLVNMPAEAAILWHPIDFDHDAICKMSRYTTYIAAASSSFVLIAISIDRYLMICRPFLGRELGVGYAKKTCALAILLGMITTCPSLIFYGTYRYPVEKTHNVTGTLIRLEGQTCLISNYYVEHYYLPAGFYYFLFGSHSIMFFILTMVYLLIGRSLFMSTNVGLSDEERHGMKIFGISMMSAFTGTVPSSHGDKKSIGSRASSLENLHRLDKSSFSMANYSVKDARNSSETTFSSFSNDDFAESHNNTHVELDLEKDFTTDNQLQTQENGVKVSMQERYCTNNSSNGHGILVLNTHISVPTSHSFDDGSDTKIVSTPKLHLKMEKQGQITRCATVSSEATSVSNSQTPIVQTTPNCLRGILNRYQSNGSNLRLNNLIMDELRQREFKEMSLRRNTLMMRMVTIAFVVSFLPFLIIVTLRYANTDIPTQLSREKQIVYHIFLRLYFINSMINPFIYGFMNKEFRAKLKLMFCKSCTQQTDKLPITLT